MKDVTKMVNQNSDASGVRTTSLAHMPVNANTSARLTVLTSQSPKFLTKEIALDDQGKMVKIPSAHLTKGRAKVVPVQSLQEFSQLLQGLEHTQALVYGVPKGALLQPKIVTKKVFESLSDTKNVITRSNDHFEWPSSAGIMMFDYDPDGEPLSQEAVLDLLYQAYPPIKDVDHLWWTSSSSNISNSETGEKLSGVTGQRVYMIVKDASDIPRAAKVIEDSLWLAGHGYIKITKSGAMLERVPFDMSVYQPSGLDFAAGASTVHPLLQDRGKPVLIKGTNNALDSKSVLLNLLGQEKVQADENRIASRAINEPKAIVNKEQFIAFITEKIFTNDKSIGRENIPKLIDGAIKNNYLDPAWPLNVWDGRKLTEVSVNTVISDKYNYHECLCLDPIEPDYDDRRIVGKLFLLQETPILYSFARGGQSFRLHDFDYEIQLQAEIHNATNKTLDILEKRSEVFTYGESLVVPMQGKLVNQNRVKLMYLLAGIINYKNDKRFCDPSRILVDSVIEIGATRNINPVKGFVDHPIIDANLRPFFKQGYDRTMQILGRFDHTEFDVVDRKLTDDEVMFHLDRIYTPFTGFDVAGVDDNSVLMAAIFSGVVRQVLPTCPAFGFDAPMQGSGKTLLAETIAIITSGTKASAIAPGRTDYDEEFRKRLMALFLKGEKAYLFDNIVGQFDSASLAAALTNEVYEDRILQHSKTVKTYVKAMFLFTGNNLRFTGDMNRRVLTVRLKPADSKLAQREYQFDPTVKAKQMRKEIISSVLSLVNHWKHCGAPRASGTMTSFSEWDTLVRQPLAFIARELPQTKLVDVLDVSTRQQADSGDKESLTALLVALTAFFGEGGGFKAGDVFDAYKESERSLIRDAILAFISRDKLQSSQHIGNLLKRFKDRNVEGLVLESKKVSGSLTYWVKLTDDTHREMIGHLTTRPHGSEASNDPSRAA